MRITSIKEEQTIVILLNIFILTLLQHKTVIAEDVNFPIITLENEILEKGFNAGTLQKMQNLNYELLKLDKAALEQGKDKKRKSNANQKEFEKRNIKAIQFKKQFYNQIEILNRQSLPLQQNYKKKVRAYFSDTKKD